MSSSNSGSPPGHPQPEGIRSRSPLQPINFTFSAAPGNHPFQPLGANTPLSHPSPSHSTAKPPSLPLPPLCPDCAALDLEAALNRAHALYEGARRLQNTRQLVTCRARSDDAPAYLRDFYFVASLGRRLSETPRRDCRLCDFFRLHATAHDASSKGGTTTLSYKLLAVSASESHLFQAPRKDARGNWIPRSGWEAVEDNVFLAVVPEVKGVPRTAVPLRWLETELPRRGAIYRLAQVESERQQRVVVLPRELKTEADMRWAMGSLRACVKNHRGCCAPRKAPGAAMRGLRVIDCTKTPAAVVEVPWSERYVALSYVWGPSTEDWPRTVTDAVHVTKAMGERYLWVDRLCIDQSNFDEKMELISRMDDIYAGAELTIVNVAGDATTGLPGVLETPRTPQPRVELDRTPHKPTPPASGGQDKFKDAYLELLNVPEAEYEKETEGHTMWLDTYRHGLNSTMKIDLNELLSLGEDKEQANKYGITVDHLDFFKDSAKKMDVPFDEFMQHQQRLATQVGITLPELVPYFQRMFAADNNLPDNSPLPPLTRPQNQKDHTTTTSTNQPLPPTTPSPHTPNKPLVLISTLPDPRHAIRHSAWSTRGWTYQEGALSRRRLVFTRGQLYWECRAMAVHESVALPLRALHVPDATKKYLRFADYMLGGVLGDAAGAGGGGMPEVRYGWSSSSSSSRGEGEGEDDGDGVEDEVGRLDAHIRAYTARRLTDEGDSLNAFLGVAARYVRREEDGGLGLVQGIPVWKGLCADGRTPGLQHTFALGVSVWFHRAPPVERRAEFYVADCPRRGRFPSWSWIGWEGCAEFNGDNMVFSAARGAESDGEDEDEEYDDDSVNDNAHMDFFMAMLRPEWATSVNRLWSAEMLLHSEDGSYSTLLSGVVPYLKDFSGGGKNANKKWLLTIKDPLVVKHLRLMYSSRGGWKQLMGKTAEMHLSVPMTEAELAECHKAGTLVSVLLFASTVPFVWDGRARFLILRRVDDAGRNWERIGRLALTMEEWMMDRYKDAEDMVRDLPVWKYGKDITLI